MRYRVGLEWSAFIHLAFTHHNKSEALIIRAALYIQLCHGTYETTFVRTKSVKQSRQLDSYVDITWYLSIFPQSFLND